MPQMIQRRILSVSLKTAEKRYKPQKHYVYILQIRWSDRAEYVIYRKYTQFYEFHLLLQEIFPAEAANDKRLLPCLPGRKQFGRNEIRKVAQQRQLSLAMYCQTLIRLPPKISQHNHVLEFFKPLESDLNPPKDACKKPVKSSLLGALVTSNRPRKQRRVALNRSASFGSSSRSQKTGLDITAPLILQTFTVIADYAAKGKGEISLQGDREVEVVEKNENGWWFVQCDGAQGWAPACHLEPEFGVRDPDDPQPLFRSEPYITIQSYKADLEDEVTFEKAVVVNVMHKLLDGWWIVSYDGQVGYAPAAYLVPNINPHLSLTTSASTASTASGRGIIPRRVTVKKMSNKKWSSNNSAHDLTFYRKLSAKQQTQALRSVENTSTSHLIKTPEEHGVREVYEKHVSDSEDIYEDVACYENSAVVDELANIKKKQTQLSNTDNDYLPFVTSINPVTYPQPDYENECFIEEMATRKRQDANKLAKNVMAPSEEGPRSPKQYQPINMDTVTTPVGKGYTPLTELRIDDSSDDNDTDDDYYNMVDFSTIHRSVTAQSSLFPPECDDLESNAERSATPAKAPSIPTKDTVERKPCPLPAALIASTEPPSRAHAAGVKLPPPPIQPKPSPPLKPGMDSRVTVAPSPGKHITLGTKVLPVTGQLQPHAPATQTVFVPSCNHKISPLAERIARFQNT